MKGQRLRAQGASNQAEVEGGGRSPEVRREKSEDRRKTQGRKEQG